MSPCRASRRTLTKAVPPGSALTGHATGSIVVSVTPQTTAKVANGIGSTTGSVVVRASLQQPDGFKFGANRNLESNSLAAEVVQLKSMVQRQDAQLQDQAMSIEAFRAEITALRQAVQGGAPMSNASPPTCTRLPISLEGAVEKRVGTHVEERALEPDFKSSTFAVRLDRSQGGQLGLELDEYSLSIQVIDEVGLIADWNRSNPDHAICPGHRLVEVNGHNDFEQIVQALTNDAVLEVTLSRQ